LENEVNFLYFEINRPASTVLDVMSTRPNVNAFSGGRNPMWQALRAVGQSGTTSLPVVIYTDRNGRCLTLARLESSDASYENVSRILGRTISPLPTPTPTPQPASQTTVQITTEPIQTSAPQAIAETGLSLELRFSIGSTSFTHNGITRYTDAPVFIDNAYGRTMVPIRVIAESLGASVDWYGTSRTVVIVRNGVTLHLPLDTPLPNGMGIPVIVNGRTFVPLAYVSEMLGANVQWDATNRVVYVSQFSEMVQWQAPTSISQPTPSPTLQPLSTPKPTPYPTETPQPSPSLAPQPTTTPRPTPTPSPTRTPTPISAPAINPVSQNGIANYRLQDGVVGRTYSDTIVPIEILLPLNWSIVSGSLPDGIRRGADYATTTFWISGMPTVAGTYEFTIRAENNTGFDEKTFILVINNAQPTPTPTPIDIFAFERRVLELVNIERANHGLNPLIWHTGLANIARAHSEDMARNNMTGHTGSDGSSPRDRVTRVGITDVRYTGENAYASPSTPEAAVQGWMNSPGHRDNILNPNHTHLGVGLAYIPGSQWTFYWTQLFGR
jgi:uncharacterized protein YkwD